MSTGRERSGKGTSGVPLMTITVNGQVVTIDQRTLTMRERQAVKTELAKLPYYVPGTDPDDMDALAATIWVVMRRDDAALTFEEVCESITIATLEEAEAVEADPLSPEV